MKIAQIVCTYPPYSGGIGNSAFNFAKFFNSPNVEIITLTPKYKKTNLNSNQVVRLNPWLKYGNGAFVPQLLWKLKKYDCIYLHYPFFGGAEVIWLYKVFNKKTKLIIQYHMDVNGLSFWAKILSLPSRLVLKSLLKKADFITCASLDYVKSSQISKFYFENKSKFKEIYFGVDTSKFIPLKNKDNKNIKLLFVGGLDRPHYFKGVDILLKAVARLPKNKWELNIVGQGELIGEYIKLANKLKIKQKVNFLDNISNKDLPQIYASSDIFILPSINKNEAFGIVLLEAMASGLALIASNLPGVREVFKNEKQGLVVEPNNIEALKNKIEFLINNPEKRKNMGKEARKLAEKKYNWKKIKYRFNKILNNI